MTGRNQSGSTAERRVLLGQHGDDGVGAAVTGGSGIGGAAVGSGAVGADRGGWRRDPRLPSWNRSGLLGVTKLPLRGTMRLVSCHALARGQGPGVTHSPGANGRSLSYLLPKMGCLPVERGMWQFGTGQAVEQSEPRCLFIPECLSSGG